MGEKRCVSSRGHWLTQSRVTSLLSLRPAGFRRPRRVIRAGKPACRGDTVDGRRRRRPRWWWLRAVGLGVTTIHTNVLQLRGDDGRGGCRRQPGGKSTRRPECCGRYQELRIRMYENKQDTGICPDRKHTFNHQQTRVMTRDWRVAPALCVEPHGQR